MIYGNYNFVPVGKLDRTKFDDIAGILLRNRTELKLWDGYFAKCYGEKPSTLYGHSCFYTAMGNVDDDLFFCKENGKTYVPCEHELMEFMGYRSDEESIKYYGVIQSHCGHDYVYLFTEEELKAEFAKEGIDASLLPEEGENLCQDFLWPMGGSNVSGTWIYGLKGKAAAKEFLVQDCFGPDSEDPTMAVLAEYQWSIATDKGCAGSFLRNCGMNPGNLFQTDARVNEILEKYSLTRDDLYKEEFSGLCFSELETYFADGKKKA